MFILSSFILPRLILYFQIHFISAPLSRLAIVLLILHSYHPPYLPTILHPSFSPSYLPSLHSPLSFAHQEMRSSGGLRSGSTSTESLPAAGGFSSTEEQAPLSLGGRLEMAASHANFADAMTALSSWASMQQVCVSVCVCL